MEYIFCNTDINYKFIGHRRISFLKVGDSSFLSYHHHLRISLCQYNTFQYLEFMGYIFDFWSLGHLNNDHKAGVDKSC